MSNRALHSVTIAVAAALVAGTAAAQNDSAAANGSSPEKHHAAARHVAYRPEILVDDAVLAIGKLKRDAHAAQLLERARGVLIVPHYVKAAALVGGAGGSGVLLLQNEGKWSDPAFYHVGGGSIGLQAGGEAGPIALLLMNDKAVDAFKSRKSSWSLDGSAGLTLVNYSAAGQESAGNGDVVLWSGTEGVFGGASVGVRNIRRDEHSDRAYYGRDVKTDQILTGQVSNPHEDNAKLLHDVMPLRVASR